VNWINWKKILWRGLSIGLALAYFIGLILVKDPAGGLIQVMNAFYFAFPFGIFLGLGVASLMHWLGKGKTPLDGILLGSFFIYLGFLKTLGWFFIPWFALFLASVAGGLAWFLRIRVWKGGTGLLFHGMGYMSGLYLFLHLKEYLKGWDITLSNLSLIFQWIF